ncbi:hypothetical protein TIFTF001_006481 [Ficus carica]|uniref:Uncharacterized protein n=1 Tax=Ficus carica TaxID=3494 RepID=A0AA88ABC5_FICCA|nr:hypothetical protein TIFTF001_006481 [Ficus carica]
MTSDRRGLGRKMTPNLSKSYLEAPVCIISTAQQASPNVKGQRDPLLAQFTRSSTFDITYSAALDVAGELAPSYGAGIEAAVEYGLETAVVDDLADAINASRETALCNRAIWREERSPKVLGSGAILV